MNVSELFEILMIVLFGCSWPINLLKSWRSRTAKGKSLFFLILVGTGYAFGIAGKLLSGSFKWYVLFFYVLNFCMVSADIILYFRNVHLDRMAEKAAGEK